MMSKKHQCMNNDSAISNVNASMIKEKEELESSKAKGDYNASINNFLIEDKEKEVVINELQMKIEDIFYKENAQIRHYNTVPVRKLEEAESLEVELKKQL